MAVSLGSRRVRDRVFGAIFVALVITTAVAMTWLFRAEERTRMEERAAQAKATPGQTVGKVISRPDLILLGLILVSLLAPNYVIHSSKPSFHQTPSIY